MSNKPLKVKDLLDVKFTEVKDPDDKKSLIVKENRYMCAVTHDILSNSVPCAVLRTTLVQIGYIFKILFLCEWLINLCIHFRGDVVTMECVEKIIKKDWIHPLTSEKITEKDIIPLQRVSSTNFFSWQCFIGIYPLSHLHIISLYFLGWNRILNHK